MSANCIINCPLKLILLIILLGEVRKFIGEMPKISEEVQGHPKAPPRTSPKRLVSAYNTVKQK